MLDGVTPVPADFAARCRERGYWADQPLFEGFTGALARYAGRTALVDETGSVTYRELSDRSAHLARILLDLGFGPLDRIIVQLPNTAMFAYLYFALQRIGAAPVLALPGHRKREITQFAEISGARALAVPAATRGFDFTAMAAEVMASNPALELCFVLGADGPQPETLPDPRFLRLEELLEREPRASAQALAEVTIDPAIAEYDLSCLRVIQSGGQRLQPEVRLRAERALPGCFIQENFGMAEGLIMFVRSTDPPDVRRETCGRPVSPDDEVYLVDEDGNVVPDGEPGELIVRGPYTLRGYFRSPEHNARAFTADGFYRSGDLLRKMPSGNYVVEGRVKDLINRGGEKISAEEVENLILAHPAVLNVACVPYPDPVLGERMCACLVLRDGRSLSLEELVTFLLSFEIATFKLPERVAFFDTLPLSGFGKVSKSELAARLASDAS